MKLELLTLRQLAKQLPLPETTAKRMRRSGVLAPDFEAGDLFLYDPFRLEALRRVVSDARNHHSIPQPLL